MASRAAVAVLPPLCLLVYAPHERARALVRGAFPRRRTRVLIARAPDDFGSAFRTHLVDAALLDVASAGNDAWNGAALAREFPSVPFFGILPLRGGDGPALARCAALDFADVLVDGVDDACAAARVAALGFSPRFAGALREPPAPLRLASALQRSTWRAVVGHAGRSVRTAELARAIGVTREHLSRSFASGGAPNLKRVIDLVRLLAAAELAKNPGYDVGDISRILGFASSSHLASTAQRVVGTRPASLARLRTVDLVDRFVRGRGRSRV